MNDKTKLLMTLNNDEKQKESDMYYTFTTHLMVISSIADIGQLKCPPVHQQCNS